MTRSPLARLSVSLLAVSVPATRAQTAPSFEVASVKPHPVERGIRPSLWVPGFQCDPTLHCGLTGNRFHEFMVNLSDLIVDAYKVKTFQIVGLPGWGSSLIERYDVEARTAENSAPTADEARLMLRSLLADRFQLRLHHETRLLPIYALVPGKNGVKVVPDRAPCLTLPDGKTLRVNPDRPRDEPFPWTFYTEQLSARTDRPVIDETGLKRAGYCTADGQDPLLVIAIETSSANGAGSSIYTAVEQKWGMKLEPKKAPVDVLVIDNVGRPSGN